MADIARLQAENAALRSQLPSEEAGDDHRHAVLGEGGGSLSGGSASLADFAGSGIGIGTGSGTGGGGMETSASPSLSVSVSAPSNALAAASSSSAAHSGRDDKGTGRVAVDAIGAAPSPPRSKRARLGPPQSEFADEADEASVHIPDGSGSSHSNSASAATGDPDPRLAAWQPPSALAPSEDEAALLRLYFTTENVSACAGESECMCRVLPSRWCLRLAACGSPSRV